MAQPVEIRRLKGTSNQTRDRRRQEPEFLPAMEIPYAPEHLNDGAKELWQRASMQMAAGGILFPTCFEYLDSYCRAWMMKENAWDRIVKYGELVVNQKGDEVPNPAMKIYQIAIDQMVIMGAKLGISPADKTKVSKDALGGKNTDKNSQKKIGLR